MNRTGMSGDLLVWKLSGLLGSDLSVVSGFHLGRRQVAAVLVEAAVVEPVDPFGGGELDVVDVAPGASSLDQLGLVEAVDRFGQGVDASIDGKSSGRHGVVDRGPRAVRPGVAAGGRSRGQGTASGSG